MNGVDREPQAIVLQAEPAPKPEIEGAGGENPREFGGDRPVERIADDRLNRANFVGSLARGVTNMKAPHGLVIAVSGEWGSGKSSILNFLIEEIEESEKDAVQIVEFNPWWFSGRTELASAFVSELGASLPNASKLKPLFRKYGATVAGLTGALTGGAVSTLATAAGTALANGPSMATLKAEISDAMRELNKRILIVVDDVDRLDADEAADLFSVIKALGDFPNTIYLIACDLSLIGEQLDKRFPGEGRKYLDKIVQVSFPVPLPTFEALHELAETPLAEIVGDPRPELRDDADWDSALNDLVLPMMRNPRDVVRLVNSLSVTYPAVEGEVNVVDFLLVEVLRVFEPHIYEALRTQPEQFSSNVRGITDLFRTDELKERRKRFLNELVDEVEYLPRREPVRKLLSRLFPDVADLFSISQPQIDDAHRKRLIRDDRSMQTYFSFGLSVIAVSKEEVDAVIASMPDPTEFARVIAKSEEAEIVPGLKRFSVLISEIESHLDKVDPATVPEALKILLRDGDNRVNFDEQLRVFPRPMFRAIMSLFGSLLGLLPEGERLAAAENAFKEAEAISLCTVLLRDLEDRTGVHDDKTAAESKAAGAARLVTGVLGFDDLTALEGVMTNLYAEAADEVLFESAVFIWSLNEWQLWNPTEFHDWMHDVLQDDARLEHLLRKARKRVIVGEVYQLRGQFQTLSNLYTDEEVADCVVRLFGDSTDDDTIDLCCEYILSAPEILIDDEVIEAAKVTLGDRVAK